MAEEAHLQQPSAPSILLTPKAIEVVKQMRAKEGLSEAHALRIAVVGGGCSGFSYQLNFDQHMQQDDQVIEYDGVRVLVDPTSAQYLTGTEIDFVATLHGGGFKFANPKATQTCGCGSSFSA
jgi:iron-sulfur cluster assembly accessory protein